MGAMRGFVYTFNRYTGEEADALQTTHLVGIVEELQDGKDAGSDEQTHLAPDVTCETREKDDEL